MGRTRGLEFRVYLEGVRLPVQPRSIQVESASGTAARLNISLPPFSHTILTAVKPNMHVAAFWRNLDDASRTDDRWRLLGEGEVSGYRHGKSATGYIYADLVVKTLDNRWAETYAMTFTSESSFHSTLGSENRLLFGTNGLVVKTSVSEGQIPLPVETDIQNLLKKPGLLIPEIFVELLGYVRTVSEVFKSVDDRLHVVNRLAFVPDEEIKALISKKQLQGIVNKVFTDFPEDGRLLSILQAMLANVSYLYQSCPMPTLVDRKLKQFFLTPDVPFSAPPRCNVFFSSSVTTWGFDRDFLSEPTRARYVSAPMDDQDGPFVEQYYSPVQVQQLAERIKAGTDPGKTIDGLILRTSSGVRPESREDEKGVIPMSERFHSYDVLAFEGDNVAARQKYLCGLVEFNLLLAQHQARQLSISMPYNPNPVAGMPGVFIDNDAIIFGRVARVAHMLVADGAPETQVTMTICREEDFADLTVPTWKNKRYVDQKQLDATYESFFGKGHASIMSPTQAGATSVRTSHTSQIKAARELLRLHNQSPDPAGFAEEYTNREIVSLRDLMSFLGAQADGGNYTRGPFRAEWTVAAKQIAQALSVQAQDVV